MALLFEKCLTEGVAAILPKSLLNLITLSHFSHGIVHNLVTSPLPYSLLLSTWSIQIVSNGIFNL